MAKRRKDPKGRVLKEGESWRKSDNNYVYRYRDMKRKVRSIYAKDLYKLRQREKRIRDYLDRCIDYSEGGISVIELTQRYIALKQGVRYSTKAGYDYVLNLIKKEDFCYKSIRSIKASDAKLWFVKLHKDGKRYSTLTTIRGVLKPAFQMAYDEEIIKRNPFDFVITTVVPNDSKRRESLTMKEQVAWMEFIRTDKTYSKYYDEFIVLLGTGMRVSEFCGLTKKDLDFENRRIRVERQLLRNRYDKYYVEKTKTESGRRYIPMTEEVYKALWRILADRPKLKKEPKVDGYSGFILIDKNMNPKVALHIENACRWGRKKYEKLHPDRPLPQITPHMYRHTFCTNMVNASMDMKVLQYIMGHSDIDTTLNIYTHMGYERAAAQMLQLVDKERTVSCI